MTTAGGGGRRKKAWLAVCAPFCLRTFIPTLALASGAAKSGTLLRERAGREGYGEAGGPDRRPEAPCALWRRLAVAPGQSRRSAPGVLRRAAPARPPRDRVEAAEEQAGRARLFHPVWLGTGIAVYFALRVETPGYLLALPPRTRLFAALAFWCARREARRRRAMNEARGGPEQSHGALARLLGQTSRAPRPPPPWPSPASVSSSLIGETEARSGARLESQAFGVGFHGRVLAAEQRGENGARVTLGPSAP